MGQCLHPRLHSAPHPRSGRTPTTRAIRLHRLLQYSNRYGLDYPSKELAPPKQNVHSPVGSPWHSARGPLKVQTQPIGQQGEGMRVPSKGTRPRDFPRCCCWRCHKQNICPGFAKGMLHIHVASVCPSFFGMQSNTPIIFTPRSATKYTWPT